MRALIATALFACGCVDVGSLSTGDEGDMARAKGAGDLTITFADCNDGVQNGDESDVDCGGSCKGCAQGKKCQYSSDCASMSCPAGLCGAAGACADGKKDGSETDVDCGGGACPQCADGKACAIGADCASHNCSGNVCRAATGCADGVKDGNETDVDCGGGQCAKCANGLRCGGAADCASGTCSNNVCGGAQPTCNDGIRNGNESDVDCGGGQCPKCGDNRKCNGNGDCTSNTCSFGTCLPVMMGNCMDGIKNGSETDVDCGGGTCAACRDLKHCLLARDCVANACENNVCISCSDGVKDGQESDVDCGGVCGPCNNGKRCGQNYECKSALCSQGICVDTCRDGKKDGFETDVDCGGYCATQQQLTCGPQKGCSMNSDCTNRQCFNGFCL